MRTFLLLALLALSVLAGEEEAVPLAVRLESSDARIAMEAMFELAKRGPPASMREIELLRLRLDAEDVRMRMAAAAATASMRDDGAIPQLIANMRDSAARNEDASPYHGALVAIAGSDIGGARPDAWSAWNDEVIATTLASIAQIRMAMGDGNHSLVREVLHPLLMQRTGRDLIVAMLADLGASSDPRLVALAHEGLKNINTAAARIAQHELERSLSSDDASVSSASIAAAVIKGSGQSPASRQPGPPVAPAPSRSAASSVFSFLLMLLSAGALAFGGWFAGRRWLEIKAAAKQATTRLTRKGK